MKWLVLIASLISASALATDAQAIEKADAVLVKKSEHRLFLLKNGKAFKDFHVAFGSQPKGCIALTNEDMDQLWRPLMRAPPSKFFPDLLYQYFPSGFFMQPVTSLLHSYSKAMTF